jgi:hypothetical protein
MVREPALFRPIFDTFKHLRPILIFFLSMYRQLQTRRKSLQSLVLPTVLQHLPEREQEWVGHRQVRRRGVSAVDDFGEGE